MADTISVRFDKNLRSDILRIERKWKTDRSEVVRRLLAVAIKNWKIDNFLSEIREHKISVGKAAEECGISIWEMLEILKDKNIDWVGYNEEDLKRDLSILE
ncbi:MAG: UPF0175 family protein [Nanoarchaeota archaeon]